VSATIENDPRRRILDHLPPSQRSHMSNLVLNEIRSGVTAPSMVVGNVTATASTMIDTRLRASRR
jgi:hypothetical protein